MIYIIFYAIQKSKDFLKLNVLIFFLLKKKKKNRIQTCINEVAFIVLFLYNYFLKVLYGSYIYMVGDFGGIIVAVSSYSHQETDEIKYGLTKLKNNQNMYYLSI